MNIIQFIDASQSKEDVEKDIWNTIDATRKSLKDNIQKLQFNLWKK